MTPLLPPLSVQGCGKTWLEGHGGTTVPRAARERGREPELCMCMREREREGSVYVHVLGTLSMLTYLETWLLAQTSLPIPPPPHQSPSLVCSLLEPPLDHPLVSPTTLVFYQSLSRTKHQSPGQLPAQHSSILSGQGFWGLGHRQLSCWQLPGPHSLLCSGVPFTCKALLPPLALLSATGSPESSGPREESRLPGSLP